MLASLIVGGLIGWLAGKLMNCRGGVLRNILLGIVGALLGGFLGGALFGVNYNDIFSLQGLLFSVLGALLILAIWGFLARRRA